MRVPVSLLVALGFAGCRRPEAPSAGATRPALAVATAGVEATTLARRQPVAGTIRPADHAVLSARVMGSVTRLPALGARVAAGDTVATLAAGELTARVEQARASLDQVERQLAREKSLLTKDASTADAVRLLEDQRRGTAAALAEASTLASYTAVTAPFAGVVTRRPAQEGDLAVPGTALLELEGVDRLRAEIEVPESLDPVATGTALTVEIDGRTFTGRLAEFSPAADPVARTRLARIDLPAGTAARSGQFVRVLWPAGAETSLLVPAAAVTSLGQMERVFVVSNGLARLRLVRTGGTTGDRIRILAGLEAGETVVAAPPATLRDGQPLQLRP